MSIKKIFTNPLVLGTVFVGTFLYLGYSPSPNSNSKNIFKANYVNSKGLETTFTNNLDVSYSIKNDSVHHIDTDYDKSIDQIIKGEDTLSRTVDYEAHKAEFDTADSQLNAVIREFRHKQK